MVKRKNQKDLKKSSDIEEATENTEAPVENSKKNDAKKKKMDTKKPVATQPNVKKAKGSETPAKEKDSSEKVKTGIIKQNEWVEHFRTYLKNIKTEDPVLTLVISKSLKIEGIPRKEKKFKNFLIASIGKLDKEKVDEVWDELKGAFDFNRPNANKSKKNKSKDAKNTAKSVNGNNLKKPADKKNGKKENQSSKPSPKKQAGKNKKNKAKVVEN